MKITIDTKEDSADEINKVISMLSRLVGSREGHSTIVSDDNALEQVDANLMSMFDDSSSSEASAQQEETKTEEKKEDIGVEIIDLD